MKAVFKSDVGRKREANEDWLQVDEEHGLAILADGMGGHQAGEVASRLAVDEAYGYLTERLDQAHEEKDIAKILVEAVLKAHDAIKEKAKTDLNLMGMGTTLVEMVIKDGTAHICHVGDSRAYHMRDRIQQITKDQTLGDYLVEHNMMKREEVPLQKWHTLTQAVGTSDHLVPERNQIALQAGDLFLLCSDGLTDMLTDEEIEGTIQQHKDHLDKAADALIEEANNKGGRDNISVVLVQYDPASTAQCSQD